MIIHVIQGEADNTNQAGVRSSFSNALFVRKVEPDSTRQLGLDKIIQFTVSLVSILEQKRHQLNCSIFFFKIDMWVKIKMI